MTDSMPDKLACSYIMKDGWPKSTQKYFLLTGHLEKPGPQKIILIDDP